jgi:hypothetical protein
LGPFPENVIFLLKNWFEAVVEIYLKIEIEKNLFTSLGRAPPIRPIG